MEGSEREREYWDDMEEEEEEEERERGEEFSESFSDEEEEFDASPFSEPTDFQSIPPPSFLSSLSLQTHLSDSYERDLHHRLQIKKEIIQTQRKMMDDDLRRKEREAFRQYVTPPAIFNAELVTELSDETSQMVAQHRKETELRRIRMEEARKEEERRREEERKEREREREREEMEKQKQEEMQRKAEEEERERQRREQQGSEKEKQKKPTTTNSTKSSTSSSGNLHLSKSHSIYATPRSDPETIQLYGPASAHSLLDFVSKRYSEISIVPPPPGPRRSAFSSAWPANTLGPYRNPNERPSNSEVLRGTLSFLRSLSEPELYFFLCDIPRSKLRSQLTGKKDKWIHGKKKLILLKSWKFILFFPLRRSNERRRL